MEDREEVTFVLASNVQEERDLLIAPSIGSGNGGSRSAVSLRHHFTETFGGIAIYQALSLEQVVQPSDYRQCVLDRRGRELRLLFCANEIEDVVFKDPVKVPVLEEWNQMIFDESSACYLEASLERRRVCPVPLTDFRCEGQGGAAMRIIEGAQYEFRVDLFGDLLRLAFVRLSRPDLAVDLLVTAPSALAPMHKV